MARKNLKLPEELFNALRDDKDDEQSWPHYFEEQCLHGGGEAAEVQGFEELARSVETVEERTGRIERTLEDLQR